MHAVTESASGSVDYILFDLDGTLYSARWGLEKNVSRRVNEYIARYLKLPMEEAWALRKERMRARNYGTTLEWLRSEKGFDEAETERYLAYIHPEDEADALPPDPALRSLLLSLGPPRAILTNSPREHALRILNKLELADLFPLIFDIRRNGLKGKPDPGVYGAVCAELGTRPGSCMLVDDVVRYVEGFRALGGLGVYFDENNSRPEFPGPRIQKLEELKALTGEV
ncbi:MAG: HAD-IA family hydrolase [Spirochaetaceae bacterium]|jgi:putative hydrolase of the HAD superfamily|nr:HAD-IA family hydrolase [Spirochaetaceae bacterium]